MQPWRLRSKIWLEVDGQPVIGQGRMAMLRAIHQHQSIIQASRETGISYRRMRGAIHHMEAVVGKQMVKTYRGGRSGGKAELTMTALTLMEAFKKMADGFNAEADTRLGRAVLPI